MPGGKWGRNSPKAIFFPQKLPCECQLGAWPGSPIMAEPPPRYQPQICRMAAGEGMNAWSQGGSAGAKSAAPVASSSQGAVISGGHTQHSPGRSAPIRGPWGAEGKDPRVSPSTRPSSMKLQKAPRCCRVPSWGHLRPRALVCSEHINLEPKSTPCSAARRGLHLPPPPLRPPASSGHQGLRAEMRPGTLGAATPGLAMPPSISQKNSPAEGTEGCARRTFTQGLGSAVPCMQGGAGGAACGRLCTRSAVRSGTRFPHLLRSPRSADPGRLEARSLQPQHFSWPVCSAPSHVAAGSGCQQLFPPRLESSLAEGGDLPPPLSREGPVPAVPGAVRAGPKDFPSPFPLCTPSIRTPACLSCRKKMKKKIQNI